MILIIDLNPVCKSIYNIKRIEKDIKIKSKKGIYNIGGNGLNVAQIIKKQNIDIFATGFLGGIKGRYIFEELIELDIYNKFTSIKEENKEIIILIQNEEIYAIIEEDSPNINRKEVKRFYKSYNESLEKSHFVCGLGELSRGMPEEIYFDLIQMAKSKEKNFILDTKGKELLYGLEAQPFMVKMDKNDLEEVGKIKLNNENEILTVASSIMEKGIELVVIDLKEEGMIVLNKDIGYRLKLSDEIRYNIGEDKGYTVAGFGIGISKKYDIETIIKLGQSMRIAYSLEKDLNNVNMGDIKKIMSKIQISKLDI